MIRKLWNLLMSPSSVISVGVLLIAGFFAGILFWGGLHWSIEASQSEKFCLSCHEMRDNAYAEFVGTPHHSNASGVGATCADCHVPNEWWPKMKRKVHATRELYHHFRGTIDTPEKYEEHRAVMAQRVWDTMKANDSLECRNCHQVEHINYDLLQPAVATLKQEAFARGDTCIDCHKGIAHKLPDMSSGYKRQHRDLVAMAERQGGAGNPLFPITTIAHYLDAADARAEDNAVGQVLAATRLEVLDRDGDALHVRIEGWQQEGAERIIYAMRGQRIFEATLTPATTDRVSVHGSEVDPDTDLVWNQVTLDTWVRPGEMVDDIDAIWTYTGDMYRAACGTCHSAYPPSNLRANQWIGVMRGKQESVALDAEEMRVLQKHLQLRARDTGGARAN